MKRIILLLLILPLVIKASEFIGLDDVKAGMKGVCYTVFNGTEPDSFEVEVVDIIEKYETGTGLILVKCLGEKTAATGVAQGMSGSPVYFNGRLAGSLSYTWSNLKEPYGGITPIEEMLELKEEMNAPSENGKYKRITVPIVFSNVEASAMEFLKSSGFAFYAQNSISSSGSLIGKGKSVLEPGRAIAVKLVQGDMSASAIGTVTYVDGDKIYALGHPLFQKGGVEYPVSEAYIYGILPRTDISYKMGYAFDDNAGSAVQDRLAGMLCLSDRKTPMMPVSIKFKGGRKINLEFVRDEDIISSMLPVMFLSSVVRDYRMSGPLTINYRMNIYPSNERKITYENMVSSESGLFECYLDMMGILNVLTKNMFKKLEMDSITVDADVEERISLCSVWSIGLEKKYYAEGDTVKGYVVLKPFRGENIIEKFEMPIPHGISGDTIFLVATNGKDDMALEQARSESKYDFTDYSGLYSIVSGLKPSNTIIIKLLDKGAGFIENSKEYSNLPQTKIFQQMQFGRKLTNMGLISQSEFRTNYVVVGDATQTIKIRR